MSRFDYFYENDADMFSFIKIPKLLLLGREYESLSLLGCSLYSWLLDQLPFAVENKNIDEYGQVYIDLSVTVAMKLFGYSKGTIKSAFKELVEKDLIAYGSTVNGQQRKIYLKHFMKDSFNREVFLKHDAEEYTYYRIPKMLFKDQSFKILSIDAKLLYGLLLERVSYSRANNWIDEEGHVFIRFANKEVTQVLKRKENKVRSLFD